MFSDWMSCCKNTTNDRICCRNTTG